MLASLNLSTDDDFVDRPHILPPINQANLTCNEVSTGLSSESESITIGEDIDIFIAAKIILVGKGSSCAVAAYAHTQTIQCMWVIECPLGRALACV